MDTVFINSENSKTSDHKRLFLNLLDKINFKKSQICHFIKSLCLLHIEKQQNKIKQRQKY